LELTTPDFEIAFKAAFFGTSGVATARIVEYIDPAPKGT